MNIVAIADMLERETEKCGANFPKTKYVVMIDSRRMKMSAHIINRGSILSFFIRDCFMLFPISWFVLRFYMVCFHN